MMIQSTSTTRTPMMIQVEEIEDMRAPLGGSLKGMKVICARTLSHCAAPGQGRVRRRDAGGPLSRNAGVTFKTEAIRPDCADSATRVPGSFDRCEPSRRAGRPTGD